MSDNKKIISIDGMGGDKAPVAVLGGMNQFLFQNGEDTVFFRVFGDKKILNRLIAKYPRVARNCEIINSPDKIKSGDKVRDVIRRAQDTSMYMAIKDVREGNSSAVVSAGNTGVLMALSKLALKTINGISRPAITTMLPSGGGDQRVAILDLGANVQCDEENLFDFALLGSVYAETIGKMKKPKVGILNIGEEDTKGNESLQKLNKLLNENKNKLPYEYIGFVEGSDISGGNVQVVVTDGFTGNIVLKTVEGTAKLIKRVLMDNLKKSILAMIGAFFLIHVFKRLKNKIDPRSYAGAVFLGLNGFAIKTHGNSDALAFSNAIKYAVDLTDADFNKQIEMRVEEMLPIKESLGQIEL
ncbi:MAG: phosphate acyltransferase PlsX [Alphaproteobacteria bacterium]|nr:phosphate acyltransferase PlsX [Alphaproteobacteria bacterium]MBN2675474.1 phosphate acyltransferase PlsX [Alphaproteobacteria bacterium]